MKRHASISRKRRKAIKKVTTWILALAAGMVFTGSDLANAQSEYYINQEESAIVRMGSTGQERKIIPISGPIAASRMTILGPSPEGRLMWYETMGKNTYSFTPYSLATLHLTDLREQDAGHLYDPDVITVTLHICDQEGKDVATVPIPTRHGLRVSHAYFATPNTVVSYFQPRYGPLTASQIIRVDTGDIFTAHTSGAHGLYVMDTGAVSPDDRWVIQSIGFRGSYLLFVNGKLVAPVAMPLDWTVSPEQFDADLKAVEDALRERNRYYDYSLVRASQFYPANTRYLVLEAKVGPIETDKSFDDVGHERLFHGPDEPTPTPYDPDLWEMNGLFVVDLETLTTGDGEWTDAIVRELPGLEASKRDAPYSFFERTGGGSDLLCVDEQGRVYYIAEKSRLEDTPDRRWYFSDIEGNRLTPEGERVE